MPGLRRVHRSPLVAGGPDLEIRATGHITRNSNYGKWIEDTV